VKAYNSRGIKFVRGETLKSANDLPAVYGLKKKAHDARHGE